MEHLKTSFGGLKNAVTNVIGFMVGNNDDSLSSAEFVDCHSDCSHCCSDARSISLASSKQSHHAVAPMLL